MRAILAAVCQQRTVVVSARAQASLVLLAALIVAVLAVMVLGRVEVVAALVAVVRAV
jgi:hypothetical protein